MKIHHPTSAAVAVSYRAEVIRAGRVIDTRHGKNLIVNAGLNQMANSAYGLEVGIWNSFRVGSGTSPVKRGSGAVTFACSGSGTVTVTASAGFFTASDVGRVLKLNGTGEEITLTAYTSGTVMTGTATGTPSSGNTGSIHYVNDTALANSLVATVPAGSFTTVSKAYSNGVYTMRRTADSGTATAACTVNEIGWFYSSTMTGRVLLAAPIGLQVGDLIRMTLDVTITVDTAAKSVSAGDFSGTSRFWGDTAAAGSFNDLCPNGGIIYLFSSALSLGALNATTTPTAGNLYSIWPTTYSYPSLGVCVSTASLTVTQANGTIAALRCGSWCHNLTAPFVKNNTQTLSLTFTTTFTRTLTN